MGFPAFVRGLAGRLQRAVGGGAGERASEVDDSDWELMEAPFSSSLSRSVITHAVLGSEVASMSALPPELLLATFSHLDARALCRLSCCSTSCRAFADDPAVWLASAGQCKEAVRRTHLQAHILAAEQRALDERLLRQFWRRQWRRAAAVLQALCGAAFVLLPLALAAARGRPRGGGKAGGGAARAAAARPGVRPAEPRFDSIVWASTHCARTARPQA